MRVKTYKNHNKIFVFGLLLVAFMLSITTVKGDESYDVSFADEPTIELNHEIVTNNEVKGRVFFVNVSLENTGNIASDELTVNLTDEEGFTLSKTTTVSASEIKTISFTWSTVYLSDQTLHISFYPSDLNKATTQYNHGVTTISVSEEKTEDSNSNTPGFEIMLLIVAFIFIIENKKRKTN